MRIRSHHLRRLRGLVALLECASISYSLEGSRNELRIIGVAKPCEDLVGIVGIEVFTRIELIGVLKQGRAGRISAQA